MRVLSDCSEIVEYPTMSPTTSAIDVVLTKRLVRPRSVRPEFWNPSDRNSRLVVPTTSRSPGRNGTGMARSIRIPLSRVPLVLRSMTAARSSAGSSRISR